MQLNLRVQSPGEQRSIAFRAGQVVQIGRTEWANLCLPGDDALADVQCEITLSDDGCRLRNLAPQGGTLLNGEPAEESLLRSGDVIHAGNSQFHVEIRGLSQEASAGSQGAEEDGAESERPGDAMRLCERCDVGFDGLELPPSASLAEYVHAAIEAERFGDVAIVLSAALSKPAAVRWAANCVEESGAAAADADVAAMAAARAWADLPDEQRRRAAGVAAGEGETSAKMVAQAAFWSSGSIGAPGGPDIPADPEMTRRLVCAVVVQACTTDDAEDCLQRLRKFVDSGLSFAADEGAAEGALS